MKHAQMEDVMQGTCLHPEYQPDWRGIVDGCPLSISAICEDYKFAHSTFINWIKCKTTPQKRYLEKVTSVMRILVEQKKLVKHPSFGYASQEQIEKLKDLGLGLERDFILKQIEKQNKLQGKIR